MAETDRPLEIAMVSPVSDCVLREPGRKAR